MSVEAWKTEILGSIADVIDPHPSHRAPAEFKGGIPFPGIGDFCEDGSIDYSSCRFVKDSTFDEHQARYKIKEGDIGFGRVATIGKVIRLRPDLLPYAISPTLAVIKPRDIELSYLIEFLKSPQIEEQIRSLLTGTTRSSLGIELLRKLIISFPDFDEQVAIGKVLSTIDRAIEQTEAIIAKQQRIKTGLMQDLLTKGIDENGNIRSEETHKFKDSAIGRIPVEWEIDVLDNLLIEKRYGISTSLSEEPSGIPVLRMNNLVSGKIDFSDIKYSNREDAKNLVLNDLDILFNRTNSIDYVGRTAIYRHQEQQVSFASYLVRLVPHHKKLDPEYLNLWLNDEKNQIRVKQFATIGVQQANINPTNLGTITLAYPQTVEEQRRIVQSLVISERNLEKDNLNLKKLCSLKTGLMQDLLTGKVRVTPLLSGGDSSL